MTTVESNSRRESINYEFCILNCELNLFPLRGIHSSDCSLRPAAGYRHWTTGVLTNVGAEGDSWSSSSFAAGDHRAGYLNFNATWVNPLNAWYRSIAFPVRCVQASAGCFVQRKREALCLPFCVCTTCSIISSWGRCRCRWRRSIR